PSLDRTIHDSAGVRKNRTNSRLKGDFILFLFAAYHVRHAKKRIVPMPDPQHRCLDYSFFIYLSDGMCGRQRRSESKGSGTRDGPGWRLSTRILLVPQLLRCASRSGQAAMYLQPSIIDAIEEWRDERLSD